MERRSETRVPSTVQVRIAGVSGNGEFFAQDLVARSLSLSGALLMGLEHELRCGDGLLVQRSGIQSKFRVVWIRDGQAAIQKLHDEPCPWKEMLQEVESRG